MADGAKLMAKVADAIDLVLAKNGMEFRGNDDKFEEFAGELLALLYRYYRDLVEEDSEYVPNEGSSSSNMDTGDEEDSDSATLDSSDD